MQKLDITTIILTKNEEIHLQRCIDRLFFSKRIIIIDSGSTDLTKEIALNNKCEFIYNEWVNHSVQFNWALANCHITTQYTMRIDADEYLTDSLINELELIFIDNVYFDGIIFKRINKFLNEEITHGGLPVRLLRVWRTGQAYCENKWMDEHMKISSRNAKIIQLNSFLIDDNLNNNNWWVKKVNNYALKEAIDYFFLSGKLYISQNKETTHENNHPESLKRILKNNLFYNLPLFLRPFLFFIYSYFFKLGFLDGTHGFVFHLRQTLWYRLLVDFFIYEIKKYAKNKNLSIGIAIEELYGIKL